MRFEYLISEKGKRVPGTERMVRNCQRPKGRLWPRSPSALGRRPAARSGHWEQSRVGSHLEMEPTTLKPGVAPPEEPCMSIFTPCKDQKWAQLLQVAS